MKINRNSTIMYAMALFWLFATYLIYFLCDKHTLYRLTKENGIIESLGALFFLITAVIFFILYSKSKTRNDFFFFKTKKNLFFLILGVLFFFGFGEEISWGLNFIKTIPPETLNNKMTWLPKEAIDNNIPAIHNLPFFSRENHSALAYLLKMHNLFNVFWFCFCVLLPIASKLNSRVLYLLKRVNFPIVSFLIGIFFIVNFIVSKVFELTAPRSLYLGHLLELKETNFAFLFLFVSLYFLKNHAAINHKFKQKPFTKTKREHVELSFNK